MCHDILPLEINNTFFRNIPLGKIKCHLYNKTESFDFRPKGKVYWPIRKHCNSGAR